VVRCTSQVSLLGSWIRAKAFFGAKYLPLLRELIELANAGFEGYGAVISLFIHIQAPVRLYLKHFSKPKPRGYCLVAGIDLNSDRINMAVLDSYGRLVAARTAWFSEVTSHGYPGNRARQRRLQGLASILGYAPVLAWTTLHSRTCQLLSIGDSL